MNFGCSTERTRRDRRDSLRVLVAQIGNLLGRRLAVGSGQLVSKPRHRKLAVSAAGLAIVAFSAVGAFAAVDVSKLPPAAARTVDFAKDIQPLLAKHCYSCHGSEKQKAGLRWDDKAAALKGGDNGPVLVSGKSAESRTINLVAGLEADAVMPPKGERLSPEQIGLLRAWIDQGVNWPETGESLEAKKRNHWAFKPPVRPPLPAVKNTKWAHNPIDRFVLARLEKENLKPSPEADRVTLLRRLSLDLIGLPPTIKEVDDFLGDRRADAYERAVERLLASPHYGEKWARQWLDAARYADTNGYEKDKPRSVWPYRDWVIGAFNRDLPFDQFIIEQLAGDLLPNATREQKVATGFLRNAMLNQEGGIEPEQFRVEAMVDRLDTLGKSVLGLTMNCCQCHNHKFDPFTQKEYYQLYAFLNNDDEAFLEVPTAADSKKREEILAKIHELELKAMRETTNLTERMAAWEQKSRASSLESNVAWTVLEPKEWHNFATKFEKQDDGSLLGGGDLQPGGTMRVWTETTLTNITGFRLEALTNANLAYNGPGQMNRGGFIVKELTVEAYAAQNPTVTNKIKFRRAVADMEAPGFSVTNAIDGNLEKGGWCPSYTPDHRNQNHVAAFECEQPFGFPGSTKLAIIVHELRRGEDEKVDCTMLGCLRLSVTTNASLPGVNPLPPAARTLLTVPAERRSPAQQRELFRVFRLSDPAFAELNQKIEEAWKDWPYPPTTLVFEQRAAPRLTHVFKRGDRLRPGEEVAAEVPTVLNPLPPGAARDRLGLAKWIVDPRSPTTARVAVNRLWLAYFGQGLVTTPEDFGTRVETPSHPELLDWLACEFMQPTEHDEFRMTNGAAKTPSVIRHSSLPPWSLKHLHRLIVTSATYRQSSKVPAELYAKDQFNRLLARAPRLRVEGEVVQDLALSVGGLLSLKVGGPSVYPPISGNVGDTVYGGFSWPESKGEDRYRRGLYTYWKRSLPFPTLSAFDAPSGEISCPRRTRSNTPLQALTTLNERTFVEAAQAMGLLVLKEGGKDDRSKMIYAFRLVAGRAPTPDESAKLLKFWDEQYRYFEDRTAAALSVALTDPKAVPTDVNVHKAAAWAMVSRALLNLDETVTRE